MKTTFTILSGLRSKPFSSIFFFFFSLLALSNSWAATKTWVAAGSGSWATGANWSGGTAPAANDDIIFDPTVDITVSNVPTVTIRSITVGTTNGRTVTLTPATTNILTITVGSITLAAGANCGLVVGSGLTLASSVTTTINAGATLTVATGGTATFTTTGNVTGAGNLVIAGTVNNQTTGATAIQPTSVTVNTGGVYVHGRDGGALTSATWTNGSTCRISGITATIPTANINQNFYNWEWNCAQTANLTLGIGSGFAVAGNLTVLRTSNNVNSANNINNNPAVGFALTLFNGSTASDLTFSIGQNLVVGTAAGNSTNNAFLILSNGTGTNTTTFNVGNDVLAQGNNGGVAAGTGLARLVVSTNVRPCSLVVAGQATFASRSEFHLLDPGAISNCTAYLSVAEDLLVGETSRTVANDNATFHQLWLSGNTSSGHTANVVVGAPVGSLQMLNIGTYNVSTVLTSGTVANCTTNLTINGNLILNGTGNAGTTNRFSYRGYNSSLSTLSNSTMALTINKVSGQYGNLLQEGAAGFQLYMNTSTPAATFAGTNCDVNFTIQGDIAGSGTPVSSGFATIGSGTNNDVTLAVTGSITTRGNTQYLTAGGNSNTLTVSAQHLTVLGGTTLIDSVGGTATGCLATLNLSGTLNASGGILRIQASSATDVANQAVLNVGGNLLVNGGTVQMNTASVDNLVSQINLTGNAKLLSGGLVSAGTPNTNRRGRIRFTGGGTHTLSGSTTVSGWVFGNFVDFEVLGSNTVQVASSLELPSNLIVNGTLSYSATSPVTLTVTGDLSGTGTIDMRNVAHLLQLEGTGTQSIGSLLTNGAGSTVVYTSTSAQTIMALTTYDNLTLKGASTKTLTGTTTVGNTVTVEAGTLSLGTTTLTLTSNHARLTGGTLAFGTTAAQSVNLTGNVQGGTINMGASALAHTLSLQGILTGTTLTLTNNTGGTVIYNSTATTQNVVGATYNNLTIAGSGQKTSNGSALTVNGILRLQAGTLAAVLGADASFANANSALTMANGGTIQLAGGNLLASPRLGATTSSYDVVYEQTQTAGPELRPAQGFVRNLSLTGNVTVTLGNSTTLGSAATAGTLNLGTQGKLVLGLHTLTINNTTGNAVTGTYGSAASHIVTNGQGRISLVEGTAIANYNQVVPLASAVGVYSPLTLNFSAGTLAGAGISLRVVANKHPLTAANAANRYFEVQTSSAWTGVTGSLTLGYLLGDVNGSQASYVGRHLNPSTATASWSANGATLTNGGSSPNFTVNFAYTSTSALNGIYTFGEATAFPTSILYSRNTANWNAGTAFTTDGYSGSAFAAPTATSYVIIGNGRTITANIDNIQVAGLLLESTGTLELGSTIDHNLGVVSGDGTLQFTLASGEPTFPSGDFSQFFNRAQNSTVAYIGSGSYSLPSSILTYNNLTVGGGGTKQGPGSALTINRSINLGTVGTATTLVAANSVTFLGGGNNVINVPNNADIIFNQLAGTLTFDGTGIHTIAAGNRDQFFSVQNILVGTGASLNLTGGGSGNQFNIGGNLTVNTLSGAGLTTSTTFDGLSFNATGTVSAPNGALLNFTSVAIAQGVTLTNTANWVLRNDLLNNGTLNCTDGTIYWGFNGGTGLLFSSGGTPSTTFNNVQASIGNYTLTLNLNATINGSLWLNTYHGGSSAGIVIPANGSNLNFTINNLYVYAGSLAVATPSSSSTTHTLNLNGNVEVYSSQGLWLTQTSGSFTNQVNVTIGGASAKSWFLGNADQEVISFNTLTFAAGSGAVTADGQGGLNLTGAFTMSSANPVTFLSRPESNTTMRLTMQPLATVTLGGAGAGTLTLPNFSVGGESSRVNITRAITLTGCETAGTAAWNNRAVGIQGGLTVNPIISWGNNTITFTGLGDIINASDATAQWVQGNSVWIFRACGATNIANNIFFAGLTLESDVTASANVFLRSTVFNPGDNSIRLGTGAELRVSTSTTTTNPNGVFGTNCSVQGGTFSEGGSGQNVIYNATVPQIVTNRGYTNLTLNNGLKILGPGSFAVNSNLTINSTSLVWGATARTITVTGNLAASTGTLDMSGAAHILNLDGSNNALGTLITSPSFNSTVTYRGNAAQTVFGSTEYRNLTFSGTGNKTLGGNVVVGNTLTMTSGNILPANFNLTLGTDANAPGTLTYTAGGFITNGTGQFRRWYTTSGLPTTASGTSAYYPMTNAAGQRREVYLVFTAANALSAGGVVGVGHADVSGVQAIGSTLNDGGTSLVNRSRSSWTLSVPVTPTLAGGQSVTLQITGEGSCVPPDNASAQDLRLALAGSLVGTHAAIGTSTIAIPVSSRTGLNFSNLANTFYFAGTLTTLPLNVWTAIASGNWTTNGTWDQGTPPTATSVVIIPSPYTVTLTGNSACALVNVQQGAGLTTSTFTITLQGGTASSINGTLTTANTSALALFGSATSTFDNATNTTPAAPTITFNTNTSTVNYNGAGAQTVQGIQYYNLTLSTANRSGNITFQPSATTAVRNVFSTPTTFGTGFGYVTTGSTFSFNGGVAQSYGGSINFDNLTFANTANSLTLNGNLGVAGVLTRTTGAYTGGTITFNGTGAQTIPSGDYNILTVLNGSRTVTLQSSGNIQVASSFNPTYDPGIVYVTTGSTFVYTVGAGPIRNFNYNNLSLTNTNPFTFDNTSNGPGAIQIAGTFTLPDNTTCITTGSTVEYNGTGAQTVLAPFTYHNLIISGNRGSANISLGGAALTVTGNLTISATTSGVFNNVSALTLNASSNQTITTASNLNLNNLVLSGGTKILGSEIRISAASTLTLNARVETGNFDLVMGTTSGQAILANNPTGVVATTGTGRLVRFYNASNPLNITGAPANNAQNLNFPLGTSAGQTRQVYFFSAASQTPTTAGFIAVRYVDGSNSQTAPNNITVNSQLVSRITRGYWEITSSLVTPNPVAMALVSFGMFNATSSSTLRAALGADGTPTSISVPTGTWTGTGSFPSYTVSSNVSLSVSSDLNNRRYFIGTDAVNMGNAFIANVNPGNFENAASWLPTGVPDATAGVIIPNGTTINMNADQSADYLDVQAGGTLNMGTFKLNLGTGAIHNLNGTINTAADSLIGGVGGAFPNRTVSQFNTPGSSSTIIYSGAGTQRITPMTYNNLTSSSTGARTVGAGTTVTIAGTFTPGTNTYTTTGSTFIFNNAGTTTIPPCRYHNVTRSGLGNTILGTTGANSNVISISGVLTLGSGTLTTTGSTVEYNGAGSQTILARTYNNLIVSGNRGGGTITLPATGTVAVTGSFTNTASNVNFNVTNNTFDYAGAGSQTVAPFGYNNLTNSGNGPRVLSSTGTIQIAGTWSRGSGAYTVGTSTVEYNGTGIPQTIVAGDYYNLTVSNTRGNNTVTWAAGTHNIGNQLTISTSFTGGGGHSLTGTTVNFGASTSTNIPGLPYNNITNTGNGNRTLSGSIGIAGTFTPGSGSYTPGSSTVTYNGTGAQTVAAIPYNNLSVSGNRGGNIVSFSNSQTITVAGTFTLPATNVSYSVTGTTLNFNGAAQSNLAAIPGGFNNLIFSGSGTKSFASAATMLSGATLTLGGTSTLNNTTNNITLGANGNIVRSGGSLTAAPNFGTSVNVTYTTAAATTGLELPTSATALNNLVINPGAGQDITLAATTTPTVNGTLTLTSGSLNINGATSLTVNGTISATSGTLKGGTSSHLILGGTTGASPGAVSFAPGFQTLDQLTINRNGGSGALSLNSNLTVVSNITFGGTATFAINTGANILTLGSTGTVSGEANGKYVRGSLRTTRVQNNGAQTYGGMGVIIQGCNNCNMGSVQMTRRAGPGTFVTSNGKQSINRIWSVVPTTQPASPVNMVMSWISDDDNYVTPSSFLRVWKSTDNGATWKRVVVDPNQPFTNRTVGVVTSTFSDWTVSDDANPLPITLLSLSARKLDAKHNLVSWTTISEQNSRLFEIQRSTDEVNYQVIGTLEARGNSQEEKAYKFTDKNLPTGWNKLYYRLRLLSDDEDKFSPVVSVENESGKDFQVFPNPFVDRLTFTWIGTENAHVSLYDSKGVLVWQQEFAPRSLGEQSLAEGLGKLPQGLYTLRMVQGEHQQTYSLVKK